MSFGGTLFCDTLRERTNVSELLRIVAQCNFVCALFCPVLFVPTQFARSVFHLCSGGPLESVSVLFLYKRRVKILDSMIDIM